LRTPHWGTPPLGTLPSRTLAGYRGAGYLTAAETARRLGIKPATLYAYVSRGLIHAHRASDAHASLFHPEEVERLRARPARGARPELSVPSAITLLRPDGLYYRGFDATSLATTHRYEQVAALLWHGSPRDDLRWHAPEAAVEAATAAQRALAPGSLPLERLLAAAAAIATTDPLRFDVSPAAVRRLAPGLVMAMLAALGGRPRPPRPARTSPAPRTGDTPRAGNTPRTGTPRTGAGAAPRSVAADLAACLAGRPAVPPGLAEVVNAALVLLADHELAASTMAVRIAAATRSPVYSCVASGLGVLQGPLHGGMPLRVEDLLSQIRSPAGAEDVIRAHLSRGDPLWGFGHPLYEDGDPRGAALLPLVLAAAPARRRKSVEAVLAFAAANSLPPPTVDLVLATVTYCWSLPRGSGQALFAIGRTAGWIAHAIEEYERRSNYRIRAAYTGPPPQPAGH
jgi:citrate synthase